MIKKEKKRHAFESEETDESGGYDSDASINEPRIKNVFYEADLDQYLVQIFKLTIPAMISAVLG